MLIKKAPECVVAKKARQTGHVVEAHSVVGLRKGLETTKHLLAIMCCVV